MDDQDACLLEHLEAQKVLPSEDFEEIRRTLDESEKPPDVRQLLLGYRQLSAEELIEGLLATRGSDDWVVPGYVLTEEIGHGAMGTVYRAVRQSDQQPLALKLLSDKFLADRSAVERFERELELACKLKTRGLPWYGERGRCRGGNHYYVMQLVKGENLRQRMMRLNGPIEEDVAWKVLYQMSMVLQHMSKLGIVHRDIKPDNILIDDELIWLIDLGLAIQPGEDEMQLTDENLVMGTPYYMSPEQARGNRMLTVASDIYSLGATMYHAVTRRPPFDGESALEVMTHHDKTPVEPPHHVRPKLSEEFSSLIVEMMAKHPLQRPRPDKLCDMINRSLQSLHRLDREQEEKVFEPVPIDAPAGQQAPSSRPAKPASRPTRAPSSRPSRAAAPQPSRSGELEKVQRKIERSGATRKLGGPTMAHWLSFAGLTLGIGLLAFMLAGGPGDGNGETPSKEETKPPEKQQANEQPGKRPPDKKQPTKKQPDKKPPDEKHPTKKPPDTRWPPTFAKLETEPVPRLTVHLARLASAGGSYPALSPDGKRLLPPMASRRGSVLSIPGGLHLQQGAGIRLPVKITGPKLLTASFTRTIAKLDDIAGLGLRVGSLFFEIGRVSGDQRYHRVARVSGGSLETLARMSLDEAYLDRCEEKHTVKVMLEGGKVTLEVTAGGKTDRVSANTRVEPGPLGAYQAGAAGKVVIVELAVQADKLGPPDR